MDDLRQYAEELFDLELSEKQLEQIAIYKRELIDWNANKMNLTAIKEPADIDIRHFLDSLSILRDFTIDPGDRVIDIGSGAGFPGLPLAIVLPDVEVIVMDATGKKVTFLEHIIENLELDNVEAVKMRAEDAGRHAEYREGFDVVIARAVARLPALLEYMLPLAKVGGYCVAMKGVTVEEEVKDSRKALQVLGGKVRGIEDIELPDVPDLHHLIFIEKVKRTPKAYPRNAGTPTREPIS